MKAQQVFLLKKDIEQFPSLEKIDPCLELNHCLADEAPETFISEVLNSEKNGKNHISGLLIAERD